MVDLHPFPHPESSQGFCSSKHLSGSVQLFWITDPPHHPHPLRPQTPPASTYPTSVNPNLHLYPDIPYGGRQFYPTVFFSGWCYDNHIVTEPSYMYITKQQHWLTDPGLLSLTYNNMGGGGIPAPTPRATRVSTDAFVTMICYHDLFKAYTFAVRCLSNSSNPQDLAKHQTVADQLHEI